MSSVRNLEGGRISSPAPAVNTWPASDWFQGLAAASHSLLLLDYDGTLAPFVEDRLRAVLYPGVAERLLRFKTHPGTRLVFVSGRPAQELRALLPTDLRPEIWGGHGREHLSADGTLHVEPLTSAQDAALSSIRDSIAANGFASLIEHKTGSIAVHTRSLAEADATQVLTLTETVFRQLPPLDLELLPFDGGMEIRGAGCSKATAVQRILAEEASTTPVAYLGDDQTDEDAFRGLAGRGLRVLVRDQPRNTEADLWLRPPQELLAFLDRWLETVAPKHMVHD